MGQILGRADDMLIIRGVNLFHTQVEAALEDIELLSKNYQLVVSRTGSMDEVEVKIELLQDVYDELCKNCDDVFKHDNVLAVQKKLQHKIKSDIGLSMKVNIAAPETINRSEGGKLNRIVDLRKK